MNVATKKVKSHPHFLKSKNACGLRSLGGFEGLKIVIRRIFL